MGRGGGADAERSDCVDEFTMFLLSSFTTFLFLFYFNSKEETLVHTIVHHLCTRLVHAICTQLMHTTVHHLHIDVRKKGTLYGITILSGNLYLFLYLSIIYLYLSIYSSSSESVINSVSSPSDSDSVHNSSSTS